MSINIRKEFSKLGWMGKGAAVFTAATVALTPVSIYNGVSGSNEFHAQKLEAQAVTQAAANVDQNTAPTVVADPAVKQAACERTVRNDIEAITQEFQAFQARYPDAGEHVDTLLREADRINYRCAIQTADNDQGFKVLAL